MSEIIQMSEVLNVTVEPHKLPGERPAVRLVLETKTKTGKGVSEIELALAPDLAIRYGKALADCGIRLLSQQS